MTRTIITLAAIGSLALGAASMGKGRGEGGPRRGGDREGGPLSHLIDDLKLTPEQQAKVQPVVDQAKPQIRAIRMEAMQKTKAVADATLTQIRPMLTPPQQQKLDAIRKAHEDMREARKRMHEAKQQ